MSKRKAILEAIKARLETLSEISDKVFYWHDFPLEFDQDAIEWRDLSENYEENNQDLKSELFIRIKAIKIVNDENCLEVGENIVFALKKALIKQTWNGSAQTTKMINSKKVVKTSGKKAVIVEFNIKIDYRDKLTGEGS